jgi:NAD+ synthase (glutamine-hydrolysing)
LTESRALRLADAIGAYHKSLKIDLIVSAILSVFTTVTGRTPQFSSREGGDMTQDLALQNIQARLRMVTAYLFAQLLPWVRGRRGFLLVLGSANVDEGLRGYMTKYDCSSADLNPIGAISKVDLKRMLHHCARYYPVLDEIAGAPPTAELRPLEHGAGGDTEEHSQLDEDEMGMTYEELGWFGRLRKLSRCGPVSMYQKLVLVWNHLSPLVVAEKVQRFFFFYGINRHKMCTITPAYHAEAYSPDDNRFDLRQFLYNKNWDRQFNIMNDLAKQDEVNRDEQST